MSKPQKNEPPVTQAKPADTDAGNTATSATASSGASVERTFRDIAGPPPADLPDALRADAALVVTSKSERGRWRAGRGFSRSETTIPVSELTDEQTAALAADTELVVATRVYGLT
ncbi:MAG: hypothetical protein AB7U62_09310 [Pseudolabrys sp.]